MISQNRYSSSNWWDDYNGYAISDFWNEFSRSKLHVRGQAVSVILPQDTSWYRLNGGAPKVNKDIYDILTSMEIDWPFYDKWSLTSQGNFEYARDERVDMIYMVYRSQVRYIFDNNRFWGYANLGGCSGAVNNEYLVYESGETQVRIRGDGNGVGGNLDSLGSGVVLWGGSSDNKSRQRVIDVVTHEHGHYFFGSDHKLYGKMADGPSTTSEFSFSPWEMIKLGYIEQEIVNYSNPNYYLFDYMSRSGTAGTDGEILQIPINEEGSQFFLLANRSRLSEWDRRLGGDTLSEGRYNFLRNVNIEYGSGLYIYHIYNGFLWQDDEYNYKLNDKDLECADGLWHWISAGFSRPLISGGSSTVLKKSIPLYDNDNPFAYTENSKDEMSRQILFSSGSPDNFNSSPVIRGVNSLYVNDNDYYNSFALYGDRWDAWNVGYNELFSPYSSPNTKDSANQNTGIFVWLYSNSGSGPTNSASLKVYRSGHGGFSEDSILHLTPPSRPMGIKVDNHLETENIMRLILTWNHNMEPDMLDTTNKKKYKIWRATSTGMSVVPTNYTLHNIVEIDSGTAPSYIDTTIYAVGSGWPGIGNTTEYPVRYKIQAVDKYQDTSVRSDFDMGIGLIPNVGCPLCTEGPDSFISDTEIPREFKLYSNYPNPFNPVTNIKFDLLKDVQVSIKIYDIVGREVKTLVNEFKTAGRYSVTFSGFDFASGVYYYSIKAGEFEQVRKMILLK